MTDFEKSVLEKVSNGLTPEEIKSIKDLKFDEAYVKVGMFEARYDSGHPIIDSAFVLLTVLVLGLMFKFVHKEAIKFIKAFKGKKR